MADVDLEAELDSVKAERDRWRNDFRILAQRTLDAGCSFKRDAGSTTVTNPRAEAAEARLAEAERVLRRIAAEFKQPGHLAGHYARAFLTKEPSHAD